MMKRLSAKTKTSVLLAIFLFLLVNTDVRAALFSGLNFLGRSLADEFNRILVNTFDARSIPEDELSVSEPASKEEKEDNEENEFYPIVGGAGGASAVNNRGAGDRQILASPAAMTSYSVGKSGVRDDGYAEEAGGENPGSIGVEEDTATRVAMREELQLEAKVLQDELLRQLLTAAEAELAASGQAAGAEGCGSCAEGTSVAEPAATEQPSVTAAADAYTQHLNTVEAIDNVKQLLSAVRQETVAAQSTAAQSSACCSGSGAAVAQPASSGQTSTSVSSAAGTETVAVESSVGEGYYCSDGVCYFGKPPAESGAAASSSGSTRAGSSTVSTQNKNLSQQITNLLSQGTTTAAQSTVAQGSAGSSGSAEGKSNSTASSVTGGSSSSVPGASSVTADKGSSSEAVSYIDDIDDSSQSSAYSTDAAGLVKRLTELEERVGEIEQDVYGFACGDSGGTDDLSSLSAEQLQQRIAALEARVATLESVVKDIEAVYSDILNEGVDKGTADDAAGYDSDEMAAAITDIKDRLSEINGGTIEDAQEEGAVEEETTGTIVAQAQEGYVFISYKGEGNLQPFLLLGGAAQYSGEYHTSLYYDGQFMRLVEPVTQIAGTLADNGHNCIKIYLPPDNLSASDAQTLGQFIQELYGYYNIRTYIVHFAGLYAVSEEAYLLNNPTEENLEKTADLVKEFAQWVKALGPAVAAVQLGNENEYYVEGAGVYNFTSEEGDEINLSAGAYHSLMDALAGIYKKVDPDHPVFLGHGELGEEQIALLKDNLSNYDGIAVNSYCNWWEETHPSFKSVMSKEALEKHIAAQVQIAAALGKPLILSEFSETSYGDWGEAGQKEFAGNITEVLGKFMIGSNSAYPHIIVGLFWYQYFPENWKDEVHPALSGMALFEPAGEEWKTKKAFAGLSAGYKEINKNLQKLIDSALAGEKSEDDSNAWPVEKKDKKVTLYTGPGCVYCEKAKEFLRENNVEFTEVNVIDDEDAKQKIIALCGQLVAPVIEIDGEMIVGFNEEKIRAALEMDDSTDAVAAPQETEQDVPIQEREITENALDKDDSGRVITVEQGDEFSVSLSSNPSTGYDWDIYGIDETILQLEGTDFEASAASEGLYGAGGTKTFSFRAVNAGMTTLVLTYRRSWVKNEYGGIFYVTVFVK